MEVGTKRSTSVDERKEDAESKEEDKESKTIDELIHMLSALPWWWALL